MHFKYTLVVLLYCVDNAATTSSGQVWLLQTVDTPFFQLSAPFADGSFYADTSMLFANGTFINLYSEYHASAPRVFSIVTADTSLNLWTPPQGVSGDNNNAGIFPVVASNGNELVAAYSERVSSLGNQWFIKVRVSKNFGLNWEDETVLDSFPTDSSAEQKVGFRVALHYDIPGERWIVAYRGKITVAINTSHWSSASAIDFDGEVQPNVVLGIASNHANKTFLLAKGESTLGPSFQQIKIFQMGSNETSWTRISFTNGDNTLGIDAVTLKSSYIYSTPYGIYAVWTRNSNRLVLSYNLEGLSSTSWSQPEIIYTVSGGCLILPKLVFDGGRLMLHWSEREYLSDCINEDFALNDDDTSIIPGNSISGDLEADNKVVYMVSEDNGMTWSIPQTLEYEDPNGFKNSLNKAGVACDTESADCKVCFSSFSDLYTGFDKNLIVCSGVELQLQTTTDTSAPTSPTAVEPDNSADIPLETIIAVISAAGTIAAVVIAWFAYKQQKAATDVKIAA